MARPQAPRAVRRTRRATVITSIGRRYETISFLSDYGHADEFVGVVQSVIRSEATDPQAIASKELARQAWGDHPYATSINGTAATVAALTRDDLVDAAARVMARDRVVIAAAGDIDARDLGLLIDRILGDLPA